MNDLLEFLTSTEIIIVYIISALACLVCLIVYIIEKNNEKLRQKHNTKELNKLVDEIREAMPEEEEKEIYDVPILETIDTKEETSINDVLPNEPVMITSIDVTENVEPVKIEETLPEIEELEEEGELEYTTIEPDQETARLELKHLQEELERQEELEQLEELEGQPEVENIKLTSFEEEQERTAIISMEELLSKSKELYMANEITQYKDEGNEPISLQDLENQVEKQATIYEEPFIISNVVPEDGIEELNEEPRVNVQQELHLDDLNTIKEETVEPVVEVKVQEKKEPEVKKFKSSPIISPIYGIEKDVSSETELALENTANYEKLDAEIRRTNEFVMSLKELQRKLD